MHELTINLLVLPIKSCVACHTSIMLSQFACMHAYRKDHRHERNHLTIIASVCVCVKNIV